MRDWPRVVGLGCAACISVTMVAVVTGVVPSDLGETIARVALAVGVPSAFIGYRRAAAKKNPR